MNKIQKGDQSQSTTEQDKRGGAAGEVDRARTLGLMLFLMLWITIKLRRLWHLGWRQLLCWPDGEECHCNDYPSDQEGHGTDAVYRQYYAQDLTILNIFSPVLVDRRLKDLPRNIGMRWKVFYPTTLFTSSEEIDDSSFRSWHMKKTLTPHCSRCLSTRYAARRRYDLSVFGEAAVGLISCIEEPAKREGKIVGVAGFRLTYTRLLTVTLVALLASNIYSFSSFLGLYRERTNALG